MWYTDPIVGWKEIARHLGVTPQTVKLYNKKFGMPILRLPSGKPVTYPDLIRTWLEERYRLDIKAHRTVNRVK